MFLVMLVFPNSFHFPFLYIAIIVPEGGKRYKILICKRFPFLFLVEDDQKGLQNGRNYRAIYIVVENAEGVAGQIRFACCFANRVWRRSSFLLNYLLSLGIARKGGLLVSYGYIKGSGVVPRWLVCRDLQLSADIECREPLTIQFQGV